MTLADRLAANRQGVGHKLMCAPSPLVVPDVRLTEAERGTLARIRGLDPLAAHWLDEFLPGRRYYVTWSCSTRHMFLRLKNAEGLRRWQTREWRVRPDAIFEVTETALRLIESVVPVVFEGSDRPQFWVEVTLQRDTVRLPTDCTPPERVLEFVPRACDPSVPPPQPVTTHLLSYGWWNELPIGLRLEDNRFVARNPADEWVTGSGGPVPQQ